MSVKVGINGFGRVGRQVLKAILEKYPETLNVVAINDLFDVNTNAHLFKYDSNYGCFPGQVEVEGEDLVINGHRIRNLTQRDPSQLPWKDLGVEIVLESTGVFNSGAQAVMHRESGAKKVILTAPAKENIHIVLGVNEGLYDPAKNNIISNSSSTTNCLALVAKILNDQFGIVNGTMTAIHAYTNSQRLSDMGHSDLRRARSAAINIVPTTTGATRLLGVVIPELEGKLDAIAIRVPTPTVSLMDLTVEVEHETSKEELLKAFKVAAEGPMNGILSYSEDPLVSGDYKGNPHSAIIDAQFTKPLGNNMIKVLAWYDNEWAYAVRVADLTHYMAEKGL